MFVIKFAQKKILIGVDLTKKKVFFFVDPDVPAGEGLLAAVVAFVAAGDVVISHVQDLQGLFEPDVQRILFKDHRAFPPIFGCFTAGDRPQRQISLCSR